MKICDKVLSFRRCKPNNEKWKLNAEEYLMIEYSEYGILQILLKTNEYKGARHVT